MYQLTYPEDDNDDDDDDDDDNEVCVIRQAKGHNQITTTAASESQTCLLLPLVQKILFNFVCIRVDSTDSVELESFLRN
jgi:hypothetical protein